MTRSIKIKFRDCIHTRPNGDKVQGRHMYDLTRQQLVEIYVEASTALDKICGRLSSMSKADRANDADYDLLVEHYMATKIKSTVACLLVERNLLK